MGRINNRYKRDMKQTAVQWAMGKQHDLFCNKRNGLIGEQEFYDRLNEVVEQARQMEKEQIIDAWNDGYREFYDGSSTPEQYYNETFKLE